MLPSRSPPEMRDRSCAVRRADCALPSFESRRRLPQIELGTLIIAARRAPAGSALLRLVGRTAQLAHLRDRGANVGDLEPHLGAARVVAVQAATWRRVGDMR